MSVQRLAGRVAVLVGAGQTPGETIGNGRATAITFAREGAPLLLVDRDPESLTETADLARAQGTEVRTLVADVSTDDGPSDIVATALEFFGGFEILHNNVGIGAGDAPPHHLADDVYDRIMSVNLRAMWRTCRAAIPALRASGNGAIVNVSSLASIAAAGNLTAYKLSKAGVNALTQNLAITNAARGVRANAILPGFIDTPMAVDAAARHIGADRAAVAAARAAAVPMGRQGTAWDVANAALFLASDESAFITGVLLAVDGGQSARVG
ncbi:MAG TPA: SDR family NAD(P)-dependent oxidoreductase [Acidimicrobiales bacterium]|nr:SDR family NAD(P)-dependent oxidoreductase [Acidimicrobiales bacterium]